MKSDFKSIKHPKHWTREAFRERAKSSKRITRRNVRREYLRIIKNEALPKWNQETLISVIAVGPALGGKGIDKRRRPGAAARPVRRGGGVPTIRLCRHGRNADTTERVDGMTTGIDREFG